MDTSKQLGEAQAGFIAGEEAAASAVKFDTVLGVPVDIVKNGYTVTYRPDLNLHPKRRTGHTKLLDLPSFIQFFNRFKSSNSLLFSDTSGFPSSIPTFTGVFNAHNEGPEGHAHWGDYRCSFQPVFSVEWNRWMEKNKQPLAQDQFLEHLSDNLPVIIVPAAGEVLALVENLRGSVDVRFDKAMNLFNGKMKLHYSEDVKLTGGSAATKENDMEVPTELICAIQPFEFGEVYKVTNRLRYRIHNKQLLFSYEAMDTHKILMDAVNSIVTKIQEATAQTVFNGKA